MSEKRKVKTARGKYRFFMALVTVAGWIVLTRTDVALLDTSHLETILGFGLFAFLAELFLIRFPVNASHGIWISVSTPLVCAAIALYGVSAGVWVDALVSFFTGLITAWLQRSRYQWVLFNTSQSILSAAAAGYAYYWIAPQGFALQPIPLGALLVCLAVYVVTNISLVSPVIALKEHLPLIWIREQIAPLWARQVIPMFPLSLLVTIACQAYGHLGLIAVLAPFFALRHAFLVYERQYNLYHQTLRYLGFIIQRAHPYTGGHLQRVAEWGRLTAERLDLPRHRVELLYDAALLHDLGKIVLDERILNKPGKLTPEEWAQVKQHPLLGAEILRETVFLGPIVPWVAYHHERPDGTGYPHGLKRHEIPLEARIIAVVDAFDAMVGGETPSEQRKYRQPLSVDKALQELRRGAGTQFDPLVVETFERVVRESIQKRPFSHIETAL